MEIDTSDPYEHNIASIGFASVREGCLQLDTFKYVNEVCKQKCNDNQKFVTCKCLNSKLYEVCGISWKLTKD